MNRYKFPYHVVKVFFDDSFPASITTSFTKELQMQT